MSSLKRVVIGAAVLAGAAVVALRFMAPPRNVLEEAYAELIAPQVEEGAAIVVFGDPKT